MSPTFGEQTVTRFDSEIDGLAVGPDALWTTQARPSHHPYLVRLDPVTAAVTRRTRLPFPVSMITFGHGNIWGIRDWTGPNAEVVRINPANAQIVATIPMPAGATAGPLEVIGNTVWVGGVTVTPGGSWSQGVRELLPISAVSDGMGTAVRVPFCSPEDSRCSPNDEMTYSNGSLWMAGSAPGTIVQFDPARARIVRVVAVGPGSRGLAVGNGTAWTALPGEDRATRLVPIDAESGAVGAARDPGGEFYPQAVVDGSVIVSGFGGVHHDLRLARMDPESGAVSDVVPAGSDFVSGILADPSHAAIWIVHPYDITRVSLR